MVGLNGFLVGCKGVFALSYWTREMTRSLESSLLVEFLLGGDALSRDLRDLLILSSPKTSPVLRADMRSSNSPLAPPFGRAPVLPLWFERRPLSAVREFLRSIVRFFICT